MQVNRNRLKPRAKQKKKVMCSPLVCDPTVINKWFLDLTSLTIFTSC